MTKYQSLLKQFESALKRLEEVLNQEKSTLIRDAAIKRFEFTFELLWKTLRIFLREKGVEVKTPKDCFKEAFRIGWIPGCTPGRCAPPLAPRSARARGSQATTRWLPFLQHPVA